MRPLQGSDDCCPRHAVRRNSKQHFLSNCLLFSARDDRGKHSRCRGRTRRRGGCLAPGEPSRQLGGCPLTARGDRRAGRGSDARRRDRHRCQQRDLDHGGGRGATLVLAARRRTCCFSGVARSLRALASHIPVLVVAPWLSPRTQELLVAEGINYLDLSGNARLQLDNPALFRSRSARSAIRRQRRTARRASGTQGGPAGPVARRRTAAVWRARHRRRGQPGPRVHIAPSPGAGREALIDRTRGPVRSVDVAALLRRWAQSLGWCNPNNATAFLAPSRLPASLGASPGAEDLGRVVLTGSFAAIQRAIAARSSSRVLQRPQPHRRRLRLFPADAGANVTLLRSYDPSLQPCRTRRRPDLSRPGPGRHRLPDRQQSACRRRQSACSGGWPKPMRTGAPTRLDPYHTHRSAA